MNEPTGLPCVHGSMYHVLNKKNETSISMSISTCAPYKTALLYQLQTISKRLREPQISLRLKPTDLDRNRTEPAFFRVPDIAPRPGGVSGRREPQLRFGCSSTWPPKTNPRAPSTFSEGVWGGFRGSRYLLRRYLAPQDKVTQQILGKPIDSAAGVG